MINEVELLMIKTALCPPINTPCFTKLDNSKKTWHRDDTDKDITIDFVVWAAMVNKPELAIIFWKKTKALHILKLITQNTAMF